MIDTQEIEKLLQNTKMTSISDIICFIAEHVSKTINFEPLQDLSFRVHELQKPKGMDRVMIEEVKVFTQAIIDQRQDIFRREMEKYFHDNFHHAIEMQEQSRRSLQQLDLLNMINMQNFQSQSLQKKLATEQNNLALHSQSKSINKGNADKQNSEQLRKIDQISKQIAQMKIQIATKIDNYEIKEIKAAINHLNKQILNKISIQQTQKIVNNFQRDIFEKMHTSSIDFQRIEHSLKKKINDDIFQIQRALNDTKLKQSYTGKMQKKIKKQAEEHYQLLQKLDWVSQDVKKLKNEVKQCQNTLYEQVTEAHHIVEQMAERDSKIQKPVEAWSKRTAVWEAGQALKNSFVAWQRELINQNTENYFFEANKTTLKIAESGYYQFVSSIYGKNGNGFLAHSKKLPTLYVNNEPIAKFTNKGWKNSNIAVYECRQIIYISEVMSTLALKTDPEEAHASVVLKLWKL